MNKEQEKIVRVRYKKFVGPGSVFHTITEMHMHTIDLINEKF